MRCGARRAGAARLVLALEGLDPPEIGAEEALLAALADVTAPGGFVVAGLAAAASLLDGSGGSARLLRWLRRGLDMAPEAALGRRTLRSPTHLRDSWGSAFDILRIAEGVLSGFRDVVVLRRHGTGTAA